MRSGLAAGVAIGMVGDVGTRALGQQPKLFVGMILILIFAEVMVAYALRLKERSGHLIEWHSSAMLALCRNNQCTYPLPHPVYLSLKPSTPKSHP